MHPMPGLFHQTASEALRELSGTSRVVPCPKKLKNASTGFRGALGLLKNHLFRKKRGNLPSMRNRQPREGGCQETVEYVGGTLWEETCLCRESP